MKNLPFVRRRRRRNVSAWRARDRIEKQMRPAFGLEPRLGGVTQQASHSSVAVWAKALYRPSRAKGLFCQFYCQEYLPIGALDRQNTRFRDVFARSHFP